MMTKLHALDCERVVQIETHLRAVESAVADANDVAASGIGNEASDPAIAMRRRHLVATWKVDPVTRRPVCCWRQLG